MGKGDELVKKLSEDAEKIMAERFGKDTIIGSRHMERVSIWDILVKRKIIGLPTN